MVQRPEDIRARRDRILSITIEEYIKTVTPVSSSIIAEEHSLDLSSATIRNILAELEEDGYLTHPHTSAGRVPTQKGYRYYVDYLMDEIKLLEEEKSHIKLEYQKESRELERLLEKTSKVLSEATHYTSIVSLDGSGKKIFYKGISFLASYPDYQQDLNKIRSILAALDEKEHLLDLINQNLEKRINVFIGQEITCKDINSCSLVITQYHSKHGPSGRIAVLGPTRMDYERVVSTLEYVADLMEEIL